jgi:hypothetical protein
MNTEATQTAPTIREIVNEMEEPILRVARGHMMLTQLGVAKEDIPAELAYWLADTLIDDFHKLRDQIDRVFALAGRGPLPRD